jgi:hypothetical protein
MKKKGILLLVFWVNISYICFGQASEARSKTVEEIQKAFLTEELALTTDESGKFFSVYFEYRDELKKIRKDGVEDEIENAEQVLNIRKKYKSEFKAVLGSDERVNKIFVADKKFKKILQEELELRKRNKQKSVSAVL